MSHDTSVRDTFEKLTTGRARTVTDPGAPLPAEAAPTLYTDEVDTGSLGADQIEIVQLRTIPLNEATARWIGNCEKVPGERPMREDHVSLLSTAMKRGTFRPEIVNLAVCACGEDKKVYRINGQHTSWARVLLEDPPNYAPLVHLHLYKAATLAGVRALYAQYDRGAPRTKANLVESYLATIPPYSTYGRMIRGKLAAGITYYEWQKSHDRVRHDADSVVAVMTGKHKDALVHCAHILTAVKEKEVKHLTRASVIAAMVATYYAAPRVSVEFWSTVRDGTGVAATTDPRLRLRNELMSNAVGQANSKKKMDKVLSSDVVYSYAIGAWNAWRDKRPMTRMQGAVKGIRPTAK